MLSNMSPLSTVVETSVASVSMELHMQNGKNNVIGSVEPDVPVLRFWDTDRAMGGLGSPGLHTHKALVNLSNVTSQHPKFQVCGVTYTGTDGTDPREQLSVKIQGRVTVRNFGSIHSTDSGAVVSVHDSVYVLSIAESQAIFKKAALRPFHNMVRTNRVFSCLTNKSLCGHWLPNEVQFEKEMERWFDLTNLGRGAVPPGEVDLTADELMLETKKAYLQSVSESCRENCVELCHDKTDNVDTWIKWLTTHDFPNKVVATVYLYIQFLIHYATMWEDCDLTRDEVVHFEVCIGQLEAYVMDRDRRTLLGTVVAVSQRSNRHNSMLSVRLRCCP